MLIQLYPSYKELLSPRGMYLSDRLSSAAGSIVYANFISSLDGRIAQKKNHLYETPASLTNDTDLRLFLELHAQADCVVTHGGYMRSLAQSNLGDILSVGSHRLSRDLILWRQKNGLAEQPTIAICSRSLNFPIPKNIPKESIIIYSPQNHDRGRREELTRHGFRTVVLPGQKRVEGKDLLEAAKKMNLSRIYLCAGPEALESFLSSDSLDIMYLTIGCKILGGSDFLSLVEGGQLPRPKTLFLKRIVYDNQEEFPQIFMTFKRRHQKSSP